MRFESFLSSTLPLLIFFKLTEAVQTGQRQCINNFGCVTALYESDDSSLNYTMEMTPGFLGWFSVGTGDGMEGSNMQIAWVDNGNVITSQRSASGEVMPTAAAVNAQAFTSITSSITENSISVSWIQPGSSSITASSSTPFIWASNSNNNPGSDPNAPLQRHPFDQRGHFTINLLADFNPVQTTGTNDGGNSVSNIPSAPSGSGGNRDLSNASVRVQLAHAIIMFIVFLGIFPAGALLARYLRTYTAKWFVSHHSIQLIGFVLLIVGFALGVYWVSDVKSSHFNSTHEKLGLALFILVVVQVILGEVSHLIMVKKGLRSGYLHILMGIVIFGLSIWEIKMGLDEWSWNPSKGATYFTYAWAAIIALAYFLGAFLIPREIRQAKERRQHSEKGSNGSEEALRSQTRTS